LCHTFLIKNGRTHARARNCLQTLPSGIYVGRYFKTPQSFTTRLSAELEAQSRKRRATHRAHDAQKKIQRLAVRIIHDAQMSARIYRLILK